MPSLLGDEDKGIEKVYSEEEKYFLLGRFEQPRQAKNLLYQQDNLSKPTKEGPFYLCSLSPHSPQFQQSWEATPL